jgi:hypothetical protein
MLEALFNSNDFLLGKQHGFDDGINGKDKNFLRMGLSSKGVIHGQKAYDTYIAGYNAGYELGSSLSVMGLNKKSVQKGLGIQSSSLLTLNPTRPMTQVIIGQIEMLESLKSFLGTIRDQLEGSKSTLANYLDGLDGEGLDAPLLEKFRDYYDNQKMKLEGLVQEIDEEEIPYTERVIEYLSNIP